MKLFQRRRHGWEKLDDKRVENNGTCTRQKGRTPRLRFTTRIRHFLSCFKPFVCYQGKPYHCSIDIIRRLTNINVNIWTYNAQNEALCNGNGEVTFYNPHHYTIVK